MGYSGELSRVPHLKTSLGQPSASSNLALSANLIPYFAVCYVLLLHPPEVGCFPLRAIVAPVLAFGTSVDFANWASTSKVTSIPEPGSLSLLGIGLLGFGLLHLRRLAA